MARLWGDEIGLLWETQIKEKAPRSGTRQSVPDRPFIKPPPPDNYLLPTVFPTFGNASYVALDVETDKADRSRGGVPNPYHGGYIVGVSIGLPDFQEYYPVRHKDAPNLDAPRFFDWLRRNLASYKGRIVGTNIFYDMDMLAAEGVGAPLAQYDDVQLAQPLIDEEQDSYALEELAQQHLGEGKVNDDLNRLYGPRWIERTADVHPGHMRAYGIGDIDLPVRILEKQTTILKMTEKDGALYDLYRLECRLTPMLLHMRRQGVRVDLSKAEHFNDTLEARANELRDELKRMVGFEVNTNAGGSVAMAFKDQGLWFPTTKKGSPSFQEKWLKAQQHRLPNLVHDIRKLTKAKGTFVEGHIFRHQVNGRIHPSFHQLRNDEFGTVTGRFSSSDPNLQNIPVRDDEIGPMCRSMFIADEGCEFWSKDYSQIEYRLLVHYSVLGKCPGAARAAQMYRDNPDTDYHELASTFTGVPRKQAKNINFGVVYGMGIETMAYNLGLPFDEAKVILERFHTAMPYSRVIYRNISSVAASRGYVRTILKRRRHFDYWEPTNQPRDKALKKPAIYGQEAARKEYGYSVKRAFTHRGLNSVLQGSAADVIKKGMVDAWEAGIFNYIGCSLQVHDELDGNKPKGDRKADQALKELSHLLENSVALQVPLIVDGGTGANWHEAKL